MKKINPNKLIAITAASAALAAGDAMPVEAHTTVPRTPTASEQHNLSQTTRASVVKMASRIALDSETNPRWSSHTRKYRRYGGSETIIDSKISEGGGRTSEFIVYARTGHNGKPKLTAGGIDQVVVIEKGTKKPETAGFSLNHDDGSVTVATYGSAIKEVVGTTGLSNSTLKNVNPELVNTTINFAKNVIANAERPRPAI
ncbi:MAG TPA: hypothetical protein VLF79_02590 [Candidatus Saccharimonadales bacterium]|nr:hypothetical protein [Candidatus Saccharimonadales bacterium]